MPHPPVLPIVVCSGKGRADGGTFPDLSALDDPKEVDMTGLEEQVTQWRAELIEQGQARRGVRAASGT